MQFCHVFNQTGVIRYSFFLHFCAPSCGVHELPRDPDTFFVPRGLLVATKSCYVTSCLVTTVTCRGTESTCSHSILYSGSPACLAGGRERHAASPFPRLHSADSNTNNLCTFPPPCEPSRDPGPAGGGGDPEEWRAAHSAGSSSPSPGPGMSA